MNPFGCLFALLVFVLTVIVSWWMLYGILYVICLYFEWAFFSWKLVTGVWLILFLLGGLFK